MTCLVQLNTDDKLTSITDFQSTYDILCKKVSLVIPALLIKTSTWPCFADMCSKAVRVESNDEASNSITSILNFSVEATGLNAELYGIAFETNDTYKYGQMDNFVFFGGTQLTQVTSENI